MSARPAIGGVPLGGLPRVVFAVDGDSPAVEQAAAGGVDILEARVDWFKTLSPASVIEEVKRLRRHALPLIGTIRAREEGGKARISARRRAELYRKIAPLVDAVDVDLRAPCLQSVVEAARAQGNTLLLSHHDVDRTPPDAELERILSAAARQGADLIKLAVRARDERDVARLLHFTLTHRAQRLVTIALGAIGSLSRVLFPIAGSLLTYTSASPTDGQLPVRQLIEDLRRYYPRYHQALITRRRLPASA